MVVALGVYVVHLSARARFSAAVLGLVGFGVFTAAMPGLVATLRYFIFAGSNDSSISARTEDYASIPNLIVGREVFGRGLGTWSPTLYFYLDNQYLLTYLEGGLVAVAVLAVRLRRRRGNRTRVP